MNELANITVVLILVIGTVSVASILYIFLDEIDKLANKVKKLERDRRILLGVVYSAKRYNLNSKSMRKEFQERASKALKETT